MEIIVKKIEIGWAIWSEKQLLACCKTVKQVILLIENLMIEADYPSPPPTLRSSGLARLAKHHIMKDVALK